VGLPLTLLGARGDEEMAVLELGISEPGEMAHLTSICEPDVAVITAVTECHTEKLGSLAGVAHEKLAIVEALKPGGVLVLPHADPNLIAPAGIPVVTFGWSEGARVRGEDFAGLGLAGCRFRVGTMGVQLRLPGRHNADNALAALAASKALGADWERAPEALAAVGPTVLRGEVRTTPAGARLLVDCYNANPKAVEAALATLGELAGGARKIAVLGEMRELGALTAVGHEQVGRAVARLGVDELYLLGPATLRTRETAVAAGLAPDKIWMYDDRDALAAGLGRRLRRGDWVLVKGSRALGLEAVVESLEARGAGGEAKQ
jgi:UDP-N-acetylmuramoyl-tripeptide--D-alanyl-D-alanine ligase